MATKNRAKTLSKLALFFLLAALITLSGCAKQQVAADLPVQMIKANHLKNVPYIENEDFSPLRHILDMYLPDDTKNFPVLFFVHGGAWTLGDKVGTRNVGLTFSQQGIGVVSVNYRLFPGAHYPEFAEDVAAAFAWTVKHIADYGGDPEKIFVAGHSAGAHLASLIATNKRFLRPYDLSPEDILGVIGISGVYRLRAGMFPRIFTTDPQVRRDASPYHHVDSSTPPFLLLYADVDMAPAASQVQDMAQALTDAKVPIRLVTVPHRNHGTILGMIGNTGDPTTTEMMDFMQRNL